MELEAEELDCTPPFDDLFNLVLGVLIIGGIIVGFLPQQLKICLLRSSEGLNIFFPLVASLGGFCSVGNVVIEQFNRIECCHLSRVSSRDCNASLLGLEQIAMQWLCLSLIFVLFVAFHEGPSAAKRRAFIALACYALFVLAVALLIGCMIGRVGTFDSLGGARGSAAHALAVTLSVIASVCNFSQLLPQIYTTWRLKAAHSLSISTLALQTPGACLWIWYQAVSNKESFWTYFPYVAHAIDMVGTAVASSTSTLIFVLLRRFAGSSAGAFDVLRAAPHFLPRVTLLPQK